MGPGRGNVLSFAGNHDRDAETFCAYPFRGARWAFLDWDLPGLRCAVHVDGRINDGSVVDRGWTVELAIPWAGMAPLANNRSLPPREGDIWRMFFGRFEKLKSAGAEIQPHPAWVWYATWRLRLAPARALHNHSLLRRSSCLRVGWTGSTKTCGQCTFYFMFILASRSDPYYRDPGCHRWWTTLFWGSSHRGYA